MGRLLAMVEEAAGSGGHRLALAEGNNQISYRTLAEQIGRVAEALPAGQSGMYGLVMDQTLPSVSLLLALLEADQGVLPVDEWLTPSDLQRISHTCPVPCWIVPDDKLDVYSQLGPIVPYSHFFRDKPHRMSITNTRIAYTGWPKLDGRDARLYQLTSGTTGEPKLAKLSLTTVLREGRVYNHWFGYNRDDRVVLTAPLNHLYGLSGGLFASLSAQSTLILCRRPTPRKALRLLRDWQGTILIGVPQFYKLLSESQMLNSADYKQMRFAISAGGPLPAGLAAAYSHKLKHRLLQVYGSTETGAIAAQHPDRSYEEGCNGELLPDVQARLQEGGQLVVTSPSLFDGYVTAAGDEDPIRNGWYATDDLAVLKNGRHVYLQGRLPKFINVAGRKLNPKEIEHVCLQMSGIVDAKAFGQADELHGEIIVVWFTTDGRVTEKELKDYLRGQLAAYKLPHIIRKVDHINRAWKETYVTAGDEGEEHKDGSNTD